MKKILLSALLLSTLAIDANAVTYAYDVPSNYTGTYALSSPANFASGSSLASSRRGKYYVNAGHGGFDSDDRPTPMPLMSEYYYESEGNLDRALHLQQWFIQNGGSVKMSRTKNTSANDLNLTTIASYSSSYGGAFLSLHSNGANASANYHIALYKGKNSSELVSGSKNMAYQDSKFSYAVNLTEYTYGTARSMADYDLMGWHYGVLRTNTAPGYLVETWFHDYRPEALRFKSSLYNKFLAWQIARSKLTNPGGTGSLPACIVGDVRDVTKSCGYTSYTTRGRDTYLALNNVTVTLKNSSGATVATCSTGAKCNGVYAFFVPAGTYTITATKSGYKDGTVSSFTVSANSQYEKSINMVEGTNAGISVSSGAVAFGEITAGESSTKTVTITGESLSSNITVTNSNTSQFTVTPTSLGTTGGTLTIKYSPATAGSHSATITLKSGSYSAKITATGTAKNPPLTFTEGWNYSETSNKKATWMENWTNYRNMAYGGGKLYVVDNANIVVKVINAQTGAWIKDLDMTGVSGGANKLVDVAYVDGKILGTNIATSAEGMGTLKVYIWDHEDVAPRVLLQTTNLGGMDRIGDAIEVQGNLTSGKICYLGQQTRDYTDSDGNAVNGNCNSLVTYAITNGEVSTTPVVADIDAFIAGLSPRAVPDGNNFWLLGQQYHASQISATGELMQSIPATAFNLRQTSDGCGNDFVPFKFNGTQYAFTTDYATVYDSDSNGKIEEADVYATSLLGGRAVLIDGSEGWAVEGLKNSGNYPSAGLSSKTRNTSYSTSICVNVNGSAGVEMWVLVHNQGIAYYKHATAATNTITESTTPLVVSSVNSVAFKTNQGASVTKSITVSAARLTGDIALALSGANADQFKISSTSIAKGSDGKAQATIAITYAPNVVAESQAATLTITSAGAETVTVALSGVSEPNTYLDDQNIVLTEGWNSTGKAWFSTASPATRFIAYNDGKLYVLNSTPWNTSPEIKIIDAYTGEDTGATVNLEGVVTSGVHTSISSIRFVDGVLVGANVASATHTFYVYAWKNGVSSAPTKILTDATHGGLAMGANIYVSGSLTNGKIWATDTNAGNVLCYSISNGTVATTPNVIALKNADGEALTLGGTVGQSQVIPNSDGTFWVDGQTAYPTLFDATGKQTAVMQAGALNNHFRGTATEFFTYGTRKLAAAVSYTGATTSQSSGYFALIDVANGAANATSYLGIYPEAGLGSTNNSQYMSAVCVATDREDGDVLDVWVACALQGVAHYTYNGRKISESITSPIITTSATSLSFATTNNASVSKDITVTGANLEGDITFAISGDNADFFTVSDASIAKADATGTVEVQYAPTEAGTHSATLTISSTGAADVTIALTGTNTKEVTITGSSLTLDWKTTENIPAQGGARWGAGNDGKVYVQERGKALHCYSFDEATKAVSHTQIAEVVAAGQGFNFDDAGNALISNGWAGAGAMNKLLLWKKDAAETVSLDLTEGFAEIGIKDCYVKNASTGVESVVKGWRMDFIGRGAGDIFSEAGGSFFFSTATDTIVKVHIANGAFVAAKSALLTPPSKPSDYTSLVQPLTTDPSSNSIAFRNRNQSTFTHLDGTEWSADTKVGTANTTAGGDVVTLGGRLYTIEPAGTPNYGDGWQIVDRTTNEVVATVATTKTDAALANNSGCVTALSVEKLDEYKAYIYHYHPGYLVARYTFALQTTGVEDVLANAEAEMTLVKNGGTLEIAGVEAAAVAVYSINGALVRMVNNANEVDVEGLNGVYVVAVVDAAGATHTQKVILK